MKMNMKYLLVCILMVALLVSCEPTPPSTGTPGSGGTGPGPGDTAPSSTAPSGISTSQPDDDTPIDPNCNIGWSRLRVGDTAYVTWGDRSNRVRSEPLKKPDNVIGELYPGDLVTIIDGPVCADNNMYWKVENASISGGSGWTSEGNGNDKHWLDPWNCTEGNSYLFVHHYAYVAAGVKGLRVWDKQGSSGTEITRINDGDRLKLVGGPYCTVVDGKNLVYWQVNIESGSGETGWVAQYGFENGEYVGYLNYDTSRDQVAFPAPPSVATIPYNPKSSTFELTDLSDLGRIAYVNNDWVWTVNADGTDPLELKNPMGSYYRPEYLDWSPDGKNIVMTVGKKMFILSLDREIAFEPVDQAVMFSSPAWSPDGDYIAYTYSQYGGTYILESVKPDGTDRHQVESDYEMCYKPDWSPVGKYLIYTCWVNGGYHIFMAANDLPGRQAYEAMGQVAKYSPDGKYIAYSDPEEGLSIMNATGTGARSLISDIIYSFEWSPDSKSIAFSNNDQVYMINIEDSKVTNLTGHNIDLPFRYPWGSLSWSPDGSYLVYSFTYYYYNENTQKSEFRFTPVYIVEVSTGAKQELVEKGTIPAWTPVIPEKIVQLPDCSNEWSRLKAGEQARVMGAATDTPNRVRSGPSKTSPQIGTVSGGTILKLMEGPVCADGLVFWKVKNDTLPGGIGWTAEGDLVTYWIEPYKP